MQWILDHWLELATTVLLGVIAINTGNAPVDVENLR